MADTRPLESIQINHRHRKDLGDIKGLAKSIADIGLLHPIVITPDGELIAGQRRIEACKLLGWQEIPVNIVDLGDIVRGEHDENIVRKDFLPSEWVSIREAVEPIEIRHAEERQIESRANRAENFSTRTEPGRTLDKVARYTGISRPTLVKATEVVKAAKQEPAKFASLVAEMDRTGRVNGVYKKLKTQQQAEKIEQEPPPLPEGPYRVIVVDPPWAYSSRPNDASHRAANPYPSLSPDEIKAKPIGILAADDCTLWLWTTNAHLPLAFEVLKAWGFEYKTMLTWVKDRMGTGEWLRGQTEHCLMAIRGRPAIVLTNQTTVIYGPLREHSRKPDEFYELVETLCPGSKVELFARTERIGWVSHGDQSNLFA